MTHTKIQGGVCVCVLLLYCACTTHGRTQTQRHGVQAQVNVSFIHISKTAGVSFYNQYKHCVNFKRSSPGADEKSYRYLHDSDSGKYKLITFFRNPRQHVYSQYLECKWDTWGKKVTNGTNFPRDTEENEATGYTPAFQQWLKHFTTTPYTTEMYNCYQPYNMQTRYFETFQEGAHNFNLDGAVFTNKAAQRIDGGLWFFGITEHYTTSTCLFEYKLTGELPDHCDCTHGKKESRRHEKKETHHVPSHPFNILTNHTVELIDMLVHQDNLLYNFALGVFKRRVIELSNQTGKILCGQVID